MARAVVDEEDGRRGSGHEPMHRRALQPDIGDGRVAELMADERAGAALVVLQGHIRQDQNVGAARYGAVTNPGAAEEVNVYADI